VTIEIENYQDQKGGNVLGTFDVYMPSAQLRIKRFRLIKTRTGKLIVGYPSFCSKQASEPSGRPEFSPYIEFSRERGVQFDQAVLEALKPFLGASS
jgi:hypothetical protein